MPIIICAKCKNFVPDKNHNLCWAFPEAPGIPWEIVSGLNNHSKPLPKQKNDIVFERRRGPQR